MYLKLPNVTLIAIDTVCHDLTRLAVEDSCKNIKFGEVVVFSDKKQAAPDFATWIPTYLNSYYAAELFIYSSAVFHINTSHCLAIQWDGFVINPQAWEDDFLKYDYIGAPWHHFGTDHNVGNGGFSLRSVNLMQHLSQLVDEYPFQKGEDNTICIKYGSSLKKRGFKFADDYTALKFSREIAFTNPDPLHFGFHGVNNFPRIFTEQQLAERVALFPDYAKKRKMAEYLDLAIEDLKLDGKPFGYMREELNVEAA